MAEIDLSPVRRELANCQRRLDEIHRATSDHRSPVSFGTALLYLQEEARFVSLKADLLAVVLEMFEAEP